MYIALKTTGDYYTCTEFLGAYEKLSEAVEKAEKEYDSRVEKWEEGKCVKTYTIS